MQFFTIYMHVHQWSIIRNWSKKCCTVFYSLQLPKLSFNLTMSSLQIGTLALITEYLHCCTGCYTSVWEYANIPTVKCVDQAPTSSLHLSLIVHLNPPRFVCDVSRPQWDRDDILPADPAGAGDGHEGERSQPLHVAEARIGGLVSQQPPRLLQLPLLLFSGSAGDCGVWGPRGGLKEQILIDFFIVFECLCFLISYSYYNIF